MKLFCNFQVLLNMAMGNEHYTLPYKEYIAMGIYLLFVIGILFMLLYYSCFHPNIVHCRASSVPSSCVQTCQIVLSSLNRSMKK